MATRGCQKEAGGGAATPPSHKYMQQKGGGREVTAPQGFSINPPLLNILHNDTMRYMIIRSDIIIK